MSKARPVYGVLVVWGPRSPLAGHREVIDGLTMPDAELVAREARRLGADTASVSKAGAARHLLANMKEGDCEES